MFMFRPWPPPMPATEELAWHAFQNVMTTARSVIHLLEAAQTRENMHKDLSKTLQTWDHLLLLAAGSKNLQDSLTSVENYVISSHSKKEEPSAVLAAKSSLDKHCPSNSPGTSPPPAREWNWRPNPPSPEVMYNITQQQHINKQIKHNTITHNTTSQLYAVRR